MEQKQLIKHYCQQFKMGGVTNALDQLIRHAEEKASGYLDYTISLLGAEAAHREQNDIRKRLKAAQLPRSNDLALYDHSLKTVFQKPGSTSLENLTGSIRSITSF